MPAEIRVEMDQASLQRFVFALRLEDDGKALIRDLRKNLRVAAQPAVAAVKSSIRAMDSHSHVTPGLRAAIASGVELKMNTGTRKVGVAIRAKKTPAVRGFALAARRTNRSKGWRHPFFGDRERWYDQKGKVGWFDDTIPKFTPQFLQAGKQAMDEMAARISQRTRG